MTFRNIRIKELGAAPASAVLAPPPPPSATTVQTTDTFQPLFNGRDLTGWVPMKTVDRNDSEHQPTTGGWNVRDGELVCATSENGWLKTERQYGDYVLQLEFKLLRNSNSDVYIRFPESGRVALAGMAIQILDPNYRGKQLPPEKLTGAIYGVVGSPQPPVRPPGEWNMMEIRCEGDNVEVTLNGTRTASANMSQNPALQNRPRSGYIGIGNWHGEANGMTFRNIRIKELGAITANQPVVKYPESPVAASSGGTINFLALADPQQDAVKGNWKLTADGLVLEKPNPIGVLDLPYAPPEEYDFEIEFTPTDTGLNVNQFLSAGGCAFAWKVARKEQYAVIELLDGKFFDQRKEGVSEKTLALEPGRRYTSKVEVRRGSFRALVNGGEYLRWSGDFNRLSLEPSFKLRDNSHIGVGSVRRGVIFHRIEVREVSGKGTFARGAPAAQFTSGGAADAFTKEVAVLPAEQQVARVVAKLKELNPKFDGKETHKVEAGAVTELAISTTGVTDITPVRALKQLKKLTVAPWALNQKGSLADLSALKELPLAWLYCQNNPVSDLSPLRGLPLTVLGCGGTQVSDLSPLAGMKLTVLSVNDTSVSDLSPLNGMPLTVLWCNNTWVADFTPLKGLPLQELKCNFQPQRDADALRDIPTLRKINDQAAAVLLRQSAASAQAPRTAAPSGDIRVLIVTGVDSPAHDWRSTGPAIREEMQKDSRMKVEILNDPYRLDSMDLTKFQVVLLNFYTKDKPDPNEQARDNLKNFVNRGGGLVVFHSTCGSFRDWPEFRDLAGKIMSHQKPAMDRAGPMRVKIVNQNHPITRGMQSYEVVDELYAFLTGRKPVEVLATAHAKSTGSDEPMAFVLTYGQGRVFHIVLGHTVGAIQTPGTAELLRRGAAWVAGREPAPLTATPKR
ncbi:MAG: DUF1080 domain-containing protein [Verrucomicrobia bacterium]|nr:DUF1080 domain-containing protein [Verrucomicrobiota bacterium]